MRNARVGLGFARGRAVGGAVRRVSMQRGSPLGMSLLGLMLLGVGCVESVDGNGMAGEEPRALSGFDRVTARGGLEVAIEEGDFSVVVSIDQNLLSYVSTRVDDGTLEIAVDDANIGEKLPGPHVIINMPSLRDAETAGEGSLTATDFESDGPVSLELTGAGTLTWSGSATDLDAVLAGSGDLIIEGTADTVDLSLRGTGTLDARDLEADEGVVVLDGLGQLSVTINGPAAARAIGGRIDLYGRSSITEQDTAAGGIIVTH